MFLEYAMFLFIRFGVDCFGLLRNRLNLLFYGVFYFYLHFLDGELEFFRLFRYNVFFLLRFWRWLQVKNLLLDLHIQFINGVECLNLKLILYIFNYFLKLLMELIFTLVYPIGFSIIVDCFRHLLIQISHEHFFELINKTIDFMIAVEEEL